MRYGSLKQVKLKPNSHHSSNISATPIGRMGLVTGIISIGQWVCSIMKKAPSDSPIWQLKNGSVRLCASVYSNLFHYPMEKNSGNHNGVCRYV